jgi:hypothetical protein
MTETMSKRPHEVLDYVFDFSRWLSTGDKILSATATITPTPATGTAQIGSTTFDDMTATAWVSAGADGETAEITVKVTTDLGRTKEAVLRLRIKD